MLDIVTCAVVLLLILYSWVLARVWAICLGLGPGFKLHTISHASHHFETMSCEAHASPIAGTLRVDPHPPEASAYIPPTAPCRQ